MGDDDDRADPPRVGIIGLGNFGTYHADHLSEQGIVPVGMDIDPGARERFAETYGAEVYDDADDLFAAVDAVIITVPNRYHEEHAVAALEAGLDALLEKPMAHTVASAERIAEAARAAEGFCMLGFHNRLTDEVQVIKGLQAEGRFGEARHVEADYVRRRGIPGRGTWFTDRETAGGGALIDVGVHAIDLALYLLDFPEVVEVAGATRTEFGDREDYGFVEMWGEDAGPGVFDVEDSASAFIRCAAGKTIALEVAWAANRQDSEEFVLRGTEAGARYDRASRDLTLYETARTGADHLSDTAVTTRGTDPHTAEQRIFLEAVRSGEPPEQNTVEQALVVQRVIDAIYRSSEQGRAVSLDDRGVEAA